MPLQSGTLYIVGTPIGNMEDITLRAQRVLREVDLIAAEDTRHTGMLLARLNTLLGDGGPATATGTVAPPTSGQAAESPVARASRLRSSPSRHLISYHEFNEAKRTPELLRELQNGRSIALVSDAGMPTVSDPGQRLIRAAIDAEIAVEVIPGVSAITTALAGSGLGGLARRSLGEGGFLFYGFLPHKSGQRRKALSHLTPLPWTLLFFESPYRLLKTLHDMREILGNRRIVVARELTKKFEEILHGDIEAILKKLENRTIKGEITLVVEGSSE